MRATASLCHGAPPGLCDDGRVAGSRSSSGLRRYVTQAGLRTRILSAGRRSLPDFIIIGAQKAGTTSLFNYLSAHPQVRPAARKEVHYFDINYALGEDWYRAMFPTARSLRAGGGPRRITGEASPYYLFHPLAAQRASSLVPGARLIVLLRDPTARAWSHYRHEVTAGRETLSFADALEAEPARLAGADEAVRAGRTDDAALRHRRFSYVSRGRYADQIRTWFDHFPRESFLFLDADVLFTEPRQAWASTAQFLAIDAEPEPTFAVHNPGTGGELDDVMRRRVDALFTEANRDLENLLGRSFSWVSHQP